MPSLLKPIDSILLISDAKSEHLDRIGLAARKQMKHRLSMAREAAHRTSVPVLLTRVGTPLNSESWIDFGVPTADQIHFLPTPSVEWAETSLGQALIASNRASLILCGFWLECTVTFTALAAIGEGYDVYVLMDLTPSWIVETREPAVNRLLQTGVVPLTTPQMIMEWAETAGSAITRQELIALLSPDAEPQ